MVYAPFPRTEQCKVQESHKSERMLRSAVARSSNEIFGFRRMVNAHLKKFIVVPCNTFATCNEHGNPQNLPRLPVPHLEKTLEKYLYSVRPHLNDEEFAQTCKIVKDFGCANGLGSKLQSILENKAKEKLNWLEEWWLHSAYLDFRSSVVVHSSPGLVYPLRKFKGKDDQLSFAARIIKAALDYKLIIDGDQIKLDQMGKEPLDMAQYKKIFGTCRIPGLKRDSLSFNGGREIIVMHKNQIFLVPVWDAEGNLLDEHSILNQLNSVVRCTSQSSCAPIGILTSQHRDTWGAVYNTLISDKTNASHLEKIEKSLFIMCLDDPVGVWNHQKKCERQTVAGQQTIHGGGSCSNAANRWYDKTIQIIVGEDGVNGLTYEHSPAEGVPIAVMTDYLIERLSEDKPITPTISSPSIQMPCRLDFNISPAIEVAISEAKVNIDQMANDLDVNCFTFENYGKDFIKKYKLSPDSYIQMAIQFAFFRLHKAPGAHYESAATRKYVGGRTETIRSCSVESVAFAKTMLNPNCSHQDKVAALRTAVNAHKDYTVGALNGFGVDRHLLGLKLAAIENGFEVPTLYQDKGFIKSSQMRISTSQVATQCDGFMCYGPLVPNGYATCYNPRKSDINFATSAFKSNQETECLKYRESLEHSLLDMQEALVLASKSKL